MKVIKKIKKKLLNYYYKFINSLVFDYVGDFHEGFAKVKVFGKYNFINPNGELLWKENEFDNVWNFSNGFARVYKEGIGYNFINKQGELLWKGAEWFVYVSLFDENGIIEVVLKNKWYKLNTKGELIEK